VALTVIVEFYKGQFHRRPDRHEPAARHHRLTHRNTAPLRRLPGAHGRSADLHRFTGHAFNQSEVKEMSQAHQAYRPL